MVDDTSRLPDEVISYILSFLTVRDSVRARLSSSRWLHIPDLRSVLQFDRPNVLGNQKLEKDGPSPKSMFVGIVNRYMELSMGYRRSKLLVRFGLGNEHASHIDRWIATSNAMEVEEIALHFAGIPGENYVFPSHLVCYGKAPYLKRLSLKCCKLSLSSQCTSWISNLTTLHLAYVLLDESGWQHILSAGSNLTSLALIGCLFRRSIFINGQLLRLKKFITNDNDLDSIKLNCPNLEEFEFLGLARSLNFAHVPKLKEASLWDIDDDAGYCSKLFNHVTRNAPQLEALTLKITAEVQLFCATLDTCSLRRLNLQAWIPIGFDLFNLTNVFNACPFLKILQIEFNTYDHVVHSQRREYPSRPHLHLKEVKIIEFQDRWNEVELAMYMLRNAVALQQMVIVVPKWASKAKQKATTLLLEKKIHPTAEVIIM